MQEREKKIFRITLLGTAVNAILVALKLFAGIIGRSSALVADGVHSLSDFLTDIIVLVFVRLSGKPEDSDHGYGHGKYETFASMIIGVMLAFAGFALLVHGGKQVWACICGEELSQPGWIALAVAVASIVSKEWLFRYSVRAGRSVGSSAVIANAWHHRSDALSSVGSLVGVAGAIFLGPKWRILDPAAAVVVSLFIIKAGYDILRPSVNELLEASLPASVCEDIENTVLAVPGILKVHRLRTRRIGNRVAIDLHCKMDGDITLRAAHEIASRAEEKLKEKFGQNTTIYIHMEPA